MYKILIHHRRFNPRATMQAAALLHAECPGTPSTPSLMLQWHSVTIEWTDKNGATWITSRTDHNNPQPSEDLILDMVEEFLDIKGKEALAGDCVSWGAGDVAGKRIFRQTYQVK